MYTHMYTYAYMHTYTNTYARTCVRARTRVQIYVYIDIDLYGKCHTQKDTNAASYAPQKKPLAFSFSFLVLFSKK